MPIVGEVNADVLDMAAVRRRPRSIEHLEYWTVEHDDVIPVLELLNDWILAHVASTVGVISVWIGS